MRFHKLSIGLVFLLGILLVAALPAAAQQTGPRSYSISPGAVINDASATSSTIIVGDNGPITDLNVVLNIGHSHAGDLRITLTHESTGTSITLLRQLNGPGYQYGCGSDAIAVVLDDSAGAPLDSYDCSGSFDAPATGTWQPSDALAAFNGENLNGRWTLQITDNINTDDGVLNSWGLIFNTDQPTTPPGDGDDGGSDDGGGTPSAEDIISQVLAGGGGNLSCLNYDRTTGSTRDGVVRTDDFDDFIDVQCRIIAENTEFIRSGAEIGNQGVIDLGVIHAVDVYSTDRTNPAGAEICLRGQGDVIFMNAQQAPRQPQALAGAIDGGYTCVTLPAAGTVVLVGDSPAVEAGQPATPTDERPVSVVAGVPLTGCRITTTHIINIRSAPSLDSTVLDRVPYRLTLTATERTEDWFRVIYLDFQGWISADYLTTTGTCDL